ncbi:SnoaL-like domain-containing protein [Parafrankia irregularis]|uniref:SnoaL-like domain-containing protein n=1 Tax=Parafrankia irregularis TaxID=795642 RepID=A0A0S4QWF3_9ACTN|nr:MULTISPECIES: nuclear transport factor 2 family protein [Parafrankia]MBE3199942.1 nuclear transport factor 2 family protein [Parafrankia sp. CH37]CUU59314.1 SnoaL-like domain-containing protein [Parafrankia irregularis]
MASSGTAKKVPVEDVLTVQDIFARYCWYVDENLGEEWSELYTKDGVFEGTRPEPVIGREALAKVPGELNAFFDGRLRHQLSNLFVEYGDDSETLVARFYNQIAAWNDGTKFVMLAVSTALLVRDDPGSTWRIQRNTIRALQ